ncbi:FAD:protein FMN transferase [Geopsychrobacter electrodiphilus]|uniref:FAD:protein FMN transferase n=1 Tax=Geopsychrobacter electrodiphilus TaxID=225196 RepID=UPI00036939E9|nr:FAD:protein FMN transferase [Geopsychrobacter electrodiphilus]
MVRLLLKLLSAALLLGLVAACQQQKTTQTLHLSGATMGTTWSVSLLPGAAEPDPVVLKKKLQQRLDQINRLMSTYDPDSEISRFNQLQSTDWFSISVETAEVIRLSQKISRLSGGAFDISVGPLVELWGFGARQRQAKTPSVEQIREQLARVGYTKLELRNNPPAIRKQVPLLQLDLSAVAKGYAVDQLALLLKQQGINNFLLEIGGEMQVVGRRGDGSPWRVAIEKPLEDSREVEKVFPLSGTAVATSGNYRNFYIEDGQRYVHTIDPASGQPIRHKLASVTVLDSTCARADALATALMVLGEERGRELVEQNRIAAYFLIHDNEAIIEYSSPAFLTFMKQVKQ